jgi:hypothetical protein
MSEEQVTPKWFKSGFESLDSMPDTSFGKTQRRFWMPAEKSAKVTFVDSEPFCIWEVNMNLNGSWRNWFTSLKSMGQECPLEEAGFRPYYVGFLTVIDHSVWTDSQGKEHKDDVKLFPAKVSTMKRLKRQVEKNGPLAGCQFDVYRSDAKSASVGDEYDFLGKIEVDSQYPEAKVFDYQNDLAPKSAAELKKIVGTAEETETKSESDGENVPF